MAAHVPVTNENVEKNADNIYKMIPNFSRNNHFVLANESRQYNYPMYSQFLQTPIPGGGSVPFPYLIQPNPAYDQNVMQFLRRNTMEQNNTTIQIGIGQQFNNQFVQNQQSTQQQNPTQFQQQNPTQFQQQDPTQFQQQGSRIMKNSSSENSSASAYDLQSMDDIFDSPKSPETRLLKKKKENNESQQIDHVFCNLQRIALQGCDIAEKLVQNHHKRPCFKKIDLLCGRLKQDLTNNNNVVANINSQGVAWAVKDFIFIFTRIINAWVIMRGYVYNKSDGLNRIKDAMDPDLTKSFLAWQEATANLSESLVKSYVNLDRMVQNQRNNKDLKDSIIIGMVDLKNHPKQYDADFLNQMHQKLFNPSFAENSEETQRRHDENGTYFKSAVYKPLANDKFSSPGASHRSDMDLFKIFNNDTIHEESEACSQVLSPKPLYKRSQLKAPMSAPPKILKNPFKMKLDLVEQFDIFGLATEKRPHRIIQKSLNFGDGDKNNSEFNKIKENYKSTKKNRFFDVDSLDVGSMVDIFGHETTNQIKFLLDEILSLPQAICFMCPTLYKNQNISFYDNYILLKSDDESMNLNRIVRDIQFGKYHNISEIIYDFKVIVQNAKIVMSGNRDERAVATIQSFVSGVEDVLHHNMLANSVDE